MNHAKTCILTLLSAMLLLASVCHASGSRIALLPVEDLSQGGNGVNFNTTHILRDILREKGFTVTPHGDVISFMVKHRVRWLGYMNSADIRRLQEKLQVDYLLLGSIGQRRQSPAMAMSLHLQLIRTTDARIIWSSTAEFSNNNKINLLGLGSAMSMEDMERQVAQKAMAAIPGNHGQEPPVESSLAIESVHLTPQIVQPGTLIHCKIKLSGVPATLEKTSISFFIDNHIIDSTYNATENGFLASWPAGNINKRTMVTASITRNQTTSREIVVGQYCVDGTSPIINLQIKGQELDGIVILQKQIQILPTLRHPEPISRWQMTVQDANGNEVMGDNGSHGLPPQFSWWGQSKNGSLVPDGFYSVSLTVWDRADNSSSTQEAIQVMRTEPNMILTMAKQETHLAINLEYEGEIPLAYWRLQIRNKSGGIIAEKNGTEPSGILLLPLPATVTKNISYRLYAQDMLGNRLQREVDTVSLAAEDNIEPLPERDFLTGLKGNQMAQGELWAEDF